ncbi:MAG: branched-chain amino acid ABC transporter permease [Rhodospirillales bacterium]|nr:branched-chain amino acid ABC transporter permease [Rhodospirillales bacterium]MDP7100242.1 branched-chain amino acid ABC transporter permease [Rhodospirillales bacterium]MDP7425851.1 branched-chain amino acid ABC transporter permease [Rhodospirillales bacterium]MDP7624162.1 branched-chain amino acid ABC transporter permease [Rhodospirillales bacterium]HJO85627.1 branched-chain amino acid ABC transporter permease [Rhodospirillales bacterium]
MDFWTLANALATGLLTGLVYGLSALGLSVIFGVIRIVNFAHGEIMVMGMFFALVMFRWLGLDPMLSVPLAAAILFVFGYALQSTVISRVAHLPDHMQFLLLAAIAVMIVNGSLLIFGPDPQAINISYSFDSFDIGENLIIDKTRAYAAIAAVAISGLLLGFFKYSRTGKAIRACADNYLGAQVVGLKVDHLYALTFGIGAACLGAAGCVLLLLIEVHPYLAPGYTLLAFVIVIIGGLGSMTGALVGGILIGMSEALAAIVLQPSMKSAFSFGLLILVLLLRPQGLMGKSVK